MIKVIYVLGSVFLVSLPALASQNNCILISEPQIIKRQGNDVDQVWELADRPEFWSKERTNSVEYDVFERWVKGNLDPDPILNLIRQKEIWSNSDPDEAKRYEIVLQAKDRVIMPISCLQSLLFAEHNRRLPLIKIVGEFLAIVLRKESRLRIYFSSSDMAAIGDGNVFDLIDADRVHGWKVVAHLHNHPFLMSAPTKGGSLAPSAGDISSWRSRGQLWQIQEFWITNGLYTLNLNSDDLGKFGEAAGAL